MSQVAEEHRATAPEEVACAIITVSDTRTPATDTGGQLLHDLLVEAGFRIQLREITPDDPAHPGHTRTAARRSARRGRAIDRRHGTEQPGSDVRDRWLAVDQAVARLRRTVSHAQLSADRLGCNAQPRNRRADASHRGADNARLAGRRASGGRADHRGPVEASCCAKHAASIRVRGELYRDAARRTEAAVRRVLDEALLPAVNPPAAGTGLESIGPVDYPTRPKTASLTGVYRANPRTSFGIRLAHGGATCGNSCCCS